MTNPPTIQDSTREGADARMTQRDKNLGQDELAAILDRNSNLHRATLDLCREVEQQLSGLGIKLGGYRLEPALGGAVMRPCDQPLRQTANK